jgi:biopolymer transport protein ExbD
MARRHRSFYSGGIMTLEKQADPPSPFINVTPLIDVLLVLLIIFMVAAPLKPSRFEAKVPSPPEDRILPPNPKTLVVTIAPDQTLKLNGLTDMGTVDDMSKLNSALIALFKERTLNHVYRDEFLIRADVPEDYQIEKTVFIKAPRSINYGQVAKVIDGLKGAGANPVGLQLDDLN